MCEMRKETKINCWAGAGAMIIWIVIVFLLLTLGSGCSVLDSGVVKTSVSADGGPGVLLKTYEDSKTGLRLKTTPGGFLIRNEDSCLGTIINQDRSTQKDVYFYVQRHLPGTPDREQTWTLYRGPVEVKTSDGWLRVEGLEAIHFDSPLLQRVALRLRQPDGSATEISFDTCGHRQAGNQYERINVLFMRLPREIFKLEVFSHEGRGIFKKVQGYPHTRRLDLIHYLSPTRAQVMNIWVGWKIIL